MFHLVQGLTYKVKAHLTSAICMVPWVGGRAANMILDMGSNFDLLIYLPSSLKAHGKWA